jgi:hypothetical protein
MPSAFVIALSLHMLASTFWAGSTFTLARSNCAGFEQLRAPQLGAALIAILSGSFLGHAIHAGALTRMLQVLMVGAACALLAGAIQLAAALLARRAGWHRVGIVGQRAAAALLALTAVTMVIARYA